MSNLLHKTDTPGGIPILMVEYGYKPCKMLPLRGQELRGRAVMRGGQLICPCCERMCELPGCVAQGAEFLVIRRACAPSRGDAA